MFKKALPILLAVGVAGCATTGRNSSCIREYVLDSQFPAGYFCTNLSFQYMQAAQGVLSGQTSPELLDDPLLYLFRPTTTNKDDPRTIALAADADENNDSVLMLDEVRKGLKKLKSNYPK